MKYFFILLIFITFSCKPTQNSDNNNATLTDGLEEVETEEEVIKTTVCTTLGTVKDLTGLDGCGLMIVLDNGKKKEPVVIEDKNFKLKAGQRIRFDYEQEREVMSICMAGQSIRVTCIEEIN